MFNPIEIAYWLQSRLNRPPEALDERAFWSLYEHEDSALQAAPAGLDAGRGVELLIVVTTYRRATACATLLSKLKQALQATSSALSTSVLVLNDQRDPESIETRARARALFGRDLWWFDASRRLGKQRFWKVYQTAFLVAQKLQPSYALFLQDDLDFDATLIDEALRRWRAVAGDPRRRVLYLFSSEQDEPTGRWVHFRRRDVGGGLRLTQWFDLQAFFVDRAFFELLAYRMVPIHPNRWRRQPRISSGVGKQLTVRLQSRGNIYQAYPPLVFHGAWPSQMNPRARALRSLDNSALRERRAGSDSAANEREGGESDVHNKPA